MMVFRNSIDALMYALHEVAANGHQAEVLCSVGYMRNGLRHCSVPVSRDNIRYGIAAYREEADELFEMAKKHSGMVVLAVK